MHYLLIYELSDDYLERRGDFRNEHLKLAWRAHETGNLVLGGALLEPADQAYLLFKGDTPNAAREFAQQDPYVKNGLIKKWSVRPWMTVAGELAASPIRAD